MKKNPVQTYFILALIIAYFVLPLFVYNFLGKDFYIYSNLQKSANKLTIYSLYILLPYIFFILKYFSFNQQINYIYKIEKDIFSIFYFIFLFQLCLLFFLGFYYRFLLNADRLTLLTLQHHILISGSSYFILCGLIYIQNFKTSHFKIIILLLLIILDYMYMGKKFLYYIIGFLLYELDLSNKKNKLRSFILILFLGFIGIIFIYFLRAKTSGVTNIVFNIYSIASEFSGVHASIGYAIEFGQNINGFINLDRVLGEYYENIVGHGLALHPLAYFIIVFNQYWYIGFILYLVIFTLISSFFYRNIKDIYIFCLTINIIHFFRHGPDIFIKQLFFQSFFVYIVLQFKIIYKKI